MVTCAGTVQAQADEAGGRVVLVLPFDNRSGQANLDWIGESFATTLNQRLRSAGFLTISRDDRVYALDHLGLPAGFRPSRATTIRIAQTLDAQWVLVGSFDVKGTEITAQAQVLEVNRLTLSKPLEQSSSLPRLLEVENNLAWLSARQMDAKFAVAENTFVAASAGLKLDAYESYIRGITATTDEERLKRLKTAVSLSPGNTDALLALGKDEYADGAYDAAAAVLTKIPQNDPLALEAGFYRGLADFNAARYASAEGAFGLVSTRLPLPEVVNNQGVAMARQHKDGTPLLQRASAADPQDADYHFNVAVAFRRRGDVAHDRRPRSTRRSSCDPTTARQNSCRRCSPARNRRRQASIRRSAFGAPTPKRPFARPPSSWTRCAPRASAPCRPPNRQKSTRRPGRTT